MKKIYLLALVVLGFSANSFGQGATATATASAQIITPIAITKITDMNFGDIAVNASAGTIVLAADGTRTASSGASAATPATDVKAATFTITGVADAGYSVSLPSTVTLNNTTGAGTMTVTGFSSSLTDFKGPITDGSTTLSVGGTLNVAANQTPGKYKSLVFNVTVNYN